MGERLRSILFYYTGEQTRKYLCLSAFFSINGYFTWGERWFAKQEDAMQINSEYDVIVRLSDEIKLNDGGGNKVIDCLEKPEEGILQRLIERLYEKGYISVDEKEVLEPLIVVYETNSLREAEYNSQFYHQEEEEVDVAYQRFYAACREIRKLIKDEKFENNSEAWHLWYARGYCMRRMHELAEVVEKRKIYNIGAYVEDLKRVMKQKQWTDIAALYALMGYLWDTVSQKMNPSFGYYEECIKHLTNPSKKEKSVPFISPIYYRIGRDYQKKENNDEKASEYYKKAYECNKHNYRALYKKAVYDNKSGKYSEAEKEYEDLRKFLENIDEESYLQSIEMEYLYKVYWCLKKLGNTSETKRTEIDNKISKISAKNQDQFAFFESFYGEADCEKYFGYMKKRMEKYQEILQ